MWFDPTTTAPYTAPPQATLIMAIAALVTAAATGIVNIITALRTKKTTEDAVSKIERVQTGIDEERVAVELRRVARASREAEAARAVEALGAREADLLRRVQRLDAELSGRP